MGNQRPFHENITHVINLIPENPDEAMLRTLLHLIRTTAIPKNHETIIGALEKTLTHLTDQERWEDDFRETISSVRAQKEAAEKIAKYEGTLNFFESDSFMRDLSQLMNPSHGITEISFKAVSTGKLRVIIAFPADFTDIILGTNGLLSGSQWNENLHLISESASRV